jgi:protein-tyrosine phosphatase
MLPASASAPELRMMRAFDPALAHLHEPHPDLSVPDPYYGGPEGFDEVLEMIEKAADGIVDGLLDGRLEVR